MIKIKRFLTLGLAGLTVVAYVFMLVPNGLANAATDEGSTSLSVTPRRTMIIKPGQTIKDTLLVSDISKASPLNLHISVIDFTYLNQSGSPKFFLAKNAPQTPWSLKPYLSVPDETVTVQPGRSQTLNYSVTMPKNLGAGSYYSAIIYSTGAPSGGQVNLSASGVTLVFANVPGKVNESLTLKKFGAYPTDDTDRGDFTYFNLNEPDRMAYLLKNDGNVAEAPAGSITLRNMWGKEVLTIDSANPHQDLAIIGQTRLFTACIKSKQSDLKLQDSTTKYKTCADPGLTPGRYTATLNLYYGQNGNQTREIHKTIVFWYVPIWLIIAFFVALLIIAYIVWRVVRWIKQPSKPKKKKFKHRRR